ncbi:hypothetical protein ILUMI_22229 [Ignelater luminosus]|uniref:Uncharacterized protein n=1 Tax=Ignelater luminosus TaxID=2038154 RepID=A0A8K0CES9_IGNLU|nr:hypothetical protein ILUMI_22229 [Ignelater luminosus]
MDLDDSITKVRPHSLNTFIKKSLSTIRLSVGSQNLALREAKSFTGAIEELKAATAKDKSHGGSINCHEQIYTDVKPYKSQIDEKGYETREVISNQIFLVKDEMLTYRGKRYSLSDIATKWKKDCRMWLWKSNKHKKNKSLGELREKLQNTKIHN